MPLEREAQTVRYCGKRGKQWFHPPADETCAGKKQVIQKGSTDWSHYGEFAFSVFWNACQTKKFLQLCGILLIICGLILLVIAQIKESSWYGYSYYLFDEDGRTLLSLLGGLGCVFGVAGLLYIQFDSSNKAQLLMYDSCVMGVQPTPLQKFSLSYDEITNVEQVTVIKTDMLIIRTSITTYTVPTDNLQQAYQVLCQKVAEARAKSKAE